MTLELREASARSPEIGGISHLPGYGQGQGKGRISTEMNLITLTASVSSQAIQPSHLTLSGHNHHPFSLS